MNHRWIFKPDSSFETPGADYGPRGLEFAYRAANALVVKWPGYNVWSGRGQQTYHRAEWLIVRVLKEEYVGGDCHMMIEEVDSIEVGSRSKKSLAEARERAHALASHRPFAFPCPVCGARTVRSVDYRSVVTIPCAACGAEAVFAPAAGGYIPKERER